MSEHITARTVSPARRARLTWPDFESFASWLNTPWGLNGKDPQGRDFDGRLRPRMKDEYLKD